MMCLACHKELINGNPCDCDAAGMKPLVSPNPKLFEMRDWLRHTGYLRPDLWDSTERYDIALHFGGEVVHTGGGCMVILVPQDNGDVIGITEEVVCYYKKQDGDGDAYDVFWNRSEEAEFVSLCE